MLLELAEHEYLAMPGRETGHRPLDQHLVRIGRSGDGFCVRCAHALILAYFRPPTGRLARHWPPVPGARPSTRPGFGGAPTTASTGAGAQFRPQAPVEPIPGLAGRCGCGSQRCCQAANPHHDGTQTANGCCPRSGCRCWHAGRPTRRRRRRWRLRQQPARAASRPVRRPGPTSQSRWPRQARAQPGRAPGFARAAQGTGQPERCGGLARKAKSAPVPGKPGR